MDIILRQTMEKIWNIFISLELSWIKKDVYGETINLLLWFTHILVQLRCMSW